MSSEDYPEVDNRDSLVAGYWTLVLQIKFSESDELVNLNFASTRTPFHTARVTSVLQIDIEPLQADTVQMFYKWEKRAYSLLKTFLVRPESLQRKGRILWGSTTSVHAIRSGYGVEAYTIISYGPGPLATEISRT